MRVYITGIAGFLGSWLATELAARGHIVRGIDNLVGGDLDNLDDPFLPEQTVTKDIELRLLQTIFEGFKPEVVVHTACHPHEGLSVFSPHLVAGGLVSDATAVLSAALGCPSVKHIVFYSSMARYGSGGGWCDPPFAETCDPDPVDPYGIAKVAAEGIYQNLCLMNGVDLTILVPHNVVGPRQKYDDPYRNVLAIWANLMLQNKPTYIYGDGTHRRSFSPVRGVTQAAVKAIEWRVTGIYNLGPGHGSEMQLGDAWELVAELVGYAQEPIYLPGRPFEVGQAWLSTGRAQEELGYDAEGIGLCLAGMVNWIREKGPKPMVHHLDIELPEAPGLPETWGTGRRRM